MNGVDLYLILSCGDVDGDDTAVQTLTLSGEEK